MAIDYSIDVERGLVRATALGELNLPDSLLHVRQVFADARFRPGMDALFDLSLSSAREYTVAELRRLVGALERQSWALRSGARWAIVAGCDLDFGMSRVFEGLSAHLPIEIAVFRCREEAQAWIDSRAGAGSADSEGP
ncbi:MAG: hypothetical protein DWQ36_24580 [Acidobacteria bacterium]|nr:MAG: hypothetical protein DWQ30_16890 [Acidobacteriota bacterium]REJ99635.1 MAG: hypothetical protein DWQ36_24580 [Acidobacteriota bacterium]